MKKFLNSLIFSALILGIPMHIGANTLTPSMDVRIKLENNRILLNMLENSEKSAKQENQNQENQDNFEIENFLSFKRITLIINHLSKSKINHEDF